MVRKTSIEVYHKIKSEGLLSKMRLEAYKLLYEHGPCTASELFSIAKKINGNTSLRDCYQKRLGELRDQGAVSELGEKICSVSNRLVILWDVTDKLPIKTEKPVRRKCKACNGRGYFEQQQTKMF